MCRFTLLLVCYLATSVCHAGNVYRCVGADEVPNYTNKKIENSSCTFVAATGPGANWEKSSVYQEDLQVWIHKKKKSISSGIQVWTLFNYSDDHFNARLSKPYKSIKSLEVYNCQNQTTKTLESHYYSESNGNGEIVGGYSLENPAPANIIPDTVGESVFDFVCARKNVTK